MRKKVDPRAIKLLDERARTVDRCERWFRRLKRAFTALDKERRRLASIDKRIRALESEGNGKAV